MSKNVDLNQTIKNRLIQKYGGALGKAIAAHIQDCIADPENKTRTDIEACIRSKLINEGLTEDNVNEIIALMGYWHTVG